MRALVTGGAGFIGSNLAARLIADGHRVCVLDDFTTGHRENVPDGAEVVEGDVADRTAVASAMRDVEVVFHQAAHRSVLLSVEQPLPTDRANTHGTLTVLTEAREAGARRVVYASSSSVYGGADLLPTPESAATVPRSPYAVSKLAGEHYCRVAFELHGLETVALRYFNVYGPRQRPDSAYAAVIPLFINALRQKQAPVIHGDGHQSRDFTFVADVVDANLAAATAPAEVAAGKAYNVAGGRRASLLELLDVLSDVIGTSTAPTFTDPRPGDVRHSEADIAAARRDLGFEPRVDLAAGLSATVDWFAQRR